MISAWVIILGVISTISAILTIILLLQMRKEMLISFIVFLIAFPYLIFINLDHPVKIEVSEEKVFIISNRAVTENCTSINSFFNKNFKDGDTVYRVEKLPYWHRGAYWVPEHKITYSLEDPRK